LELPDGVTVAQQILILFAQVRILVGQLAESTPAPAISGAASFKWVFHRMRQARERPVQVTCEAPIF